MRYQYLALARFLHSGGQWPARPERGRAGQFSVCSEGSVLTDARLQAPHAQALNARFDMAALFGRARGSSSLSERQRESARFEWKWATFFNQTTAALGGGADGALSSEACECEMRPSGQLENRFYWRRGGGAPDIRLSFLGMQGNGHRSTFADWSGGWERLHAAVRGRCAAGRCGVERWASLDNERFVEERLRALRPDVVLFGPGPWMRTKGSAGAQAVRRLLQALKRAVGPGGRAIFRSCPRGALRTAGRRGCSNGGACDEPFRRELAALGWELFDLFRVTEAAHAYIERACAQPPFPGKARGDAAACRDAHAATFSDNVHFQCHVYREINRLLVGGL